VTIYILITYTITFFLRRTLNNEMKKNISGDLAQERMTSNRLWLQNLCYRKDLIMGVRSCFTPLEA